MSSCLWTCLYGALKVGWNEIIPSDTHPTIQQKNTADAFQQLPPAQQHVHVQQQGVHALVGRQTFSNGATILKTVAMVKRSVLRNKILTEMLLHVESYGWCSLKIKPFNFQLRARCTK